VDPVRGALALFVQEVLYKVLREEAADATLYAFVDEVLEVMDQAPDVRHFPLVFLLQLSGHLGFFPEPPAPGEDRFDLKEGHFTRGHALHGHTLGPPLSMALARLLDADLGHLEQLDIPAAQRRELLDHLLLYFRMHLEGSGELRSPAVLHQVLG
jgi:DNA repair protein RecO (recombination protein O)